MNAENPMIVARGLRKSFGSFTALKDVDFDVARNELVFIIGPSGSGKSTLLRCFNRLETPDSGSLSVDGIDMLSRTTNINLARRSVGMVFQSFNLYPHMSAMANVTLALRKVLGWSKAAADDAATEALRQVNLLERADHYPSQLSGGQQQRVAIARAIALKPKVMLFDEPTSALDPELVNGILEVMYLLRDRGMAMVVVSHEMAFARKAADRVVFMADGSIVEQGTAQQVFEAPVHQRTNAFIRQVGR